MTLKPTDTELAILTVLWEYGPSTVREVHERLDDSLDHRDVRYTTTLKQLQVMQDKGLVERDASSRSHVYRPAVSREKTQTALLDHLLDNAFGGSTSALFMRALSRGRTSEAELAEIKSLLDDFTEE